MQRTLAAGAKEALHPSILIPDAVENRIRWQPGQRLFDLFRQRCDALADAGNLDHPALEVGETVLSYGELRRRVDQFASALFAHGLRSGNRVGLVLDRSVDSYCVMLAAVQADLAYVPLDPKFPADRIAFIAEDADTRAIVCVDHAMDCVVAVQCPVISLSALSKSANDVSGSPAMLASSSAGRNGQPPEDTLAYIIYTSGSTGRPKGVAVNHSAIVNFIAVAAEHYGYVPSDRVYQGLTFAFDFSIEEFWVPLAVGATLVASPSDVQLVGRSLDAFLREKRITALCCVPTLLATLENDIPALRFLLVSGEACPQDLVTRWYRDDRRLLNAYGPTEATVTATWTLLAPHRKVTIGVPLPTYTIVMLDPDVDQLAKAGAAGEIAIAGPGLAEGYVNRPELTAEKFIPDFLGVANNPRGRLYRTGDLGRIDEHGEIEYLGRIDTQVKLKGYRIELGEIEEVMLAVDGVAQAVVTVYDDETTGARDLVGYITTFDPEARPSRELIASAMRARLPAYMVPAYIEPIDSIPLMPSQKADRKALPPPALPRITSSQRTFVAPTTDTETKIATALGNVLGLQQVSIADHVFDDLGLDSLGAARLIIELEETLGHGAASIANIYLKPTISELAAEIDADRTNARPTARAPRVEPASNRSHAICAALQAASYFGVFIAYAWLSVTCLAWVTNAHSFADVIWRSLAAAVIFIIAPATVAILAKWAIIGRWQPATLKLWSLAYFRFWFVRLLVENHFIAFLRGSPLFNLYLNLLGANIGKNVMILSKPFPLCTDIIEINDNAVLRRDCFVAGYRAEGSDMRIASIEIGEGAVVGEGSVVDIGTRIGAYGQLGNASALLTGQTIPDHQRYHGVPARPTEDRFDYHSSHEPSATRRVAYGCFEFTALALALAFSFAAIATTAGEAVGFHDLEANQTSITFEWATALEILWFYPVIFLLFTAVAFVTNTALPRALGHLLTPGKSYANYSLQYFLANLIANLGNYQFFHSLFGDSSYVVRYVSALGYAQPGLQQTGSNFGTALYQDHASVCSVGAGTMVSDNLYLMNFAFGSASFQVKPLALGSRLFLGNKIYVPCDATLGDNCLIASKAMVPSNGSTRSDVGLLGSPPIEIPRTTRHGQSFNPVPNGVAGFERLARKNAYNRISMAYFLLANVAAVTLGGLAAYLAMCAVGTLTMGAVLTAALAWVSVSFLVWLAQERLTLLGGPLRPTSCTIHDQAYWHVERHWKMGNTPLKLAFRGTPFRPYIYRLLGAKIGARVFDDGSSMPEKTLTSVGDDACINNEAYVQCHSLEDGLFKCDRIVIGARSTIGPNAYVHYGVVMGENSILETDAFLMKGNQTNPSSVWSGNPAAAI